MNAPFAADGDHVRLAVRVRPRASAERIEGVEIGADGRAALAVRLRAPPAEGAANKALIVLLANSLGLPKGAIKLKSGTAGRLKVLLLRGDQAQILARLTALTAPARAAET